jgi:hypothetical protein
MEKVKKKKTKIGYQMMASAVLWKTRKVLRKELKAFTWREATQISDV